MLFFHDAFHHTTPKLRFRRDYVTVFKQYVAKSREVIARKCAGCQKGLVSPVPNQEGVFANAAAGIRTQNPQLQKLVLYPIELQLLLANTKYEFPI